MIKTKLSSEELKKQVILLEHGFYDTEVQEFMMMKSAFLTENIKRNFGGYACIHGSQMCENCLRKWWFEEVILKNKNDR